MPSVDRLWKKTVAKLLPGSNNHQHIVNVFLKIKIKFSNDINQFLVLTFKIRTNEV